jgi:hypothetical protein
METTRWEPLKESAGAEVKGHVIADESVDGDYGTKPVLTISTPTGLTKVWASHMILQEELEKTPPAKDARILIRYDGSATSARGREYHRYSVAVDRTLTVPSGADWVDVFNNGAQPKSSTTPNPIRSRGNSRGQRKGNVSDLPF